MPSCAGKSTNCWRISLEESIGNPECARPVRPALRRLLDRVVVVDDLLATQPVIPVITIERVEDARPLATTLPQAGLRVLEVPALAGAVGERASLRQWLGLVLGLAGLTLVVWRKVDGEWKAAADIINSDLRAAGG